MIYTENTNSLPQYIGEEATVCNAFITQGSVVLGEVRNSVIGTRTRIEEDAVLDDCVVMAGAVIGSGAKLTRCLVAENVHVSPGAVIGKKNSEHVTLVTAKNAGGEK